MSLLFTTNTSIYSLFLFGVMQFVFITSFSQSININVGGETGTVDSGEPVPLVESYSKNGSSSVEDGNGAYTSNSLHSISAISASSWAREGNYVLKFYADGSNYPNNDYAYRAELANSTSSIAFSPGDERYYSLSFFAPDSIWDNATQYSTVISQWKQYGGGDPNAEIRLSNTGDYRLTARSVRHWVSIDDEGDVIGYATPGEWNDLKYYVKHSQGSDGVLKVWLNGELVFTHTGPTLYKNEQGYIKFGMYTEIRDERTLYFDGINITDSITVSMDTWATDQAHLPTITLTNPLDSAHLPTGSTFALSATASDPGGKKLGTSGNIEFVEFIANNVSIGIDYTSPYTVNWSPSDGPYTLKAITMDSDSNYAVSSIHDIYIGPKPPTVEITSPTHLTNYSSPQTITINASASDVDGTVAQVEFFVDSTSLGTDTSSPFSIDWVASTSGAYILSAKATDLDSKVSEIDSIGVTIGASIDTATLTSIHDATIREHYPSSTGNWSKVEVYGKQNANIVGIFKFNLASIIDEPEVRSAKLKVYVNSLDSPITLKAFSATGDDWDESTVTWNNGPTKGSEVAELSISSSGSYVEFDVKSYVRDKFSSSDTLITIWLEETTLSQVQTYFDSKSRTNVPKLEIITSSIGGADIFEEDEENDNQQNNNYVAPTLTITAPANAASYTLGNSVSITASITDPNNEFQRIAFFEDNTLIGYDSTTPYTLQYIPQTTGTKKIVLYALYQNDIAADSINITIAQAAQAGGDTTELTATDDVTIREGSVNLNGNWSKVEIYGKSNDHRIGLFKFNISSLLSETDITSAKLRVYTSTFNTNIDIATYKVIGDTWAESSVTWGTKPTKSSLITTTTFNALNQYFEIDVTQYLEDKIQNTDSNISFWLEDTNAGQNQLKFDSRTQSNPPQLRVISGNGQDLPVELYEFKAIAKEDHTLIQWSTLTEINADYFKLFVSRGLNYWKEIGEFKAQGNSNKRIDYSFEDYDLQRHYQTLKYKLIQYDLDGQFQVYGPILIQNNKDTKTLSLEVNINPISHQSTLSLQNISNSKITLQVYNHKGQQMYYEVLNVDNYRTMISIEKLYHLPPGIYHLKIIDGKEFISKKIVRN